MSDSLFDRIVGEIEGVFEPIVSALEDPGLYETLLEFLASRAAIRRPAGSSLALKPLADLGNEIATIASETSPSFADIARLLKSARDAFAAIEAMDAGGGASSSLGGLAKILSGR